MIRDSIDFVWTRARVVAETLRASSKGQISNSRFTSVDLPAPEGRDDPLPDIVPIQLPVHKDYSIFRTCSRIRSIMVFASTTEFAISVSLALDPIVLTSRKVPAL